jgi:hypothetical protein
LRIREIFKRAHRQWAEQALENGFARRDERWSEAIAVGSLPFVETVKNGLGIKATHRDVIEADGSYALREPTEAYAGKFTAENDALRTGNSIRWDESIEDIGWSGPKYTEGFSHAADYFNPY